MPRPARPNRCPECGKPWTNKDAPFPRTCEACDASVWKNLLPVGVLVIPIRNQPDHFLVVRRAPGTILENELALAGGFMEAPKTRITDENIAILVWKSEVAREALEEIGLVIDPASIQLLDAVSAPTQPGNILIFASCPPQDVPADFTPNDEVSEVVAVHASEIGRLPWSTHRAAVVSYIQKQKDARELEALRALHKRVKTAVLIFGDSSPHFNQDISSDFFNAELQALE
jgi:8-oxo-dGTP diphosphatase